MKKLLTIMALGALPMLMSAAENMEPEKISLNKGWEFSQVGKGEWSPATVPGTVHQDLIDNDKLVNSFFGMNEEKVQWVEKEDWQYKTTFNLTKEQLARQAAILNFEGLDVDLAQRIIDFACGTCVAIDGNLRRISNYIFIVTPKSVDISGDLQDLLAGNYEVPGVKTDF